MSGDKINAIVSFWLGDALNSPEAADARRDWWYRGGPGVDAQIGERFGDLVEQACAGGLAHWQDSSDGALALIVLLDQFTRNMYRHTARAYAGDTHGMQIVNRVIENGLDQELHAVARIWLYHPFHHAESVHEQDRGIALLQDLLVQSEGSWHGYIKRSISGWTRHRDIVAKFGRFPHRNSVLGRESTAAEKDFLGSNSESFGQGPR